MHVTSMQHDWHKAFDSSPVHYHHITCLIYRSSLGYADVHVVATFFGQGSQPHMTVTKILLCHMMLHLYILIAASWFSTP